MKLPSDAKIILNPEVWHRWCRRDGDAYIFVHLILAFSDTISDAERWFEHFKDRFHTKATARDHIRWRVDRGLIRLQPC